MREQRKVVTVLFCDVVGSTALGESADPEVVRARMRRYFEDLRTILERHGGTVEKFVGDAVMAVFGIPTAHEDDALRAVRAACEMRAATAEHGLQARIGVNTGEVVVGGEGETLVTGDAVNVAARLEQAAPPGNAFIGAETRLLVRDAVRVEPVEPLDLKGKSSPVQAYRLLDVLGDAAPIARHLERPLVGRERERRRLWRDYEDAVEDRTCRLFTLLGPAGIGKSRLVADFLQRVGDSADVLRGRCLSYGEGITYWPLVEMLEPLGVAVESVVFSTLEETRVAFRKLLETRAAERPQIVVVDDLQWAEPVFHDLVEHVADLSRNAPIFLLCVARTELLDVRPDWGGGKLNATSLLLEPLDADECDELMKRLDASLDAGLRERITAASQGNPLYVEEMVAVARDSGAGDSPIPSTIHALLQARIDALDDESRIVLERSAIEGEVFHLGAVAALVPDDMQEALESQLAALVRKDLIRAERPLYEAEDAYRFRHLLIREAAYASMPKELRSDLHERFADWLAATDAGSGFERDEIVGYHLEQSLTLHRELGVGGAAEGELAARAGSTLVAAGLRALARADLGAATGLLQRGVDLLPATDPRRLGVLPDLGFALVRRGELEGAAALLRDGLDEARTAGDVRSRARIRLVLDSVLSRMDPEWSVGRQLADALEIAESLERAGDTATLAQAYSEIGMCRFLLGHAGEGVADLERAATLAREIGDGYLERTALNRRLRPIAYGPTPAETGTAFCDSLLENERTNVHDRAHALQVRGLLLAMQGDLEGARESSSRAWALIDEFGLTLIRGIYAIDTGCSYALAGELGRAEAELRRGRDAMMEVGDTGVRATVVAVLADVVCRLGRHEEALGFVDECRAIAGQDDLDVQPRWRVTLARILSAQGDHAGAEALLHEADALLEPLDFIDLHADVFDALGEVLAHAERADEAVAAFERAAVLHEQKGNVVSAARSRSQLAGVRAPS